MDSFKKDLRSVLIAEKDGIRIQFLDKEYHDLIGEHIQYDTNLYPTLCDFLLTLPDACRVVQQGYETLVFPVTSAKQEDLRELVLGQKDSKYQQLRKKNLAGRNVFNKYFGGGGFNRPYPRTNLRLRNSFNNINIGFRQERRPFSPRNNFSHRNEPLSCESTPRERKSRERKSRERTSIERPRRRRINISPDKSNEKSRDDKSIPKDDRDDKGTTRRFSSRFYPSDRRNGTYKPNLDDRKRSFQSTRRYSKSPDRSKRESFDENYPKRRRVDSSTHRSRSKERKDSSTNELDSRKNVNSSTRSVNSPNKDSTSIQDSSRRRRDSSNQSTDQKRPVIKPNRFISSLQKFLTKEFVQTSSKPSITNSVKTSDKIYKNWSKEDSFDVRAKTNDKSAITVKRISNVVEDEISNKVLNDPRPRAQSLCNENQIKNQSNVNQDQSNANQNINNKVTDLKTKMNDSFDVRSANKSIPVKLFTPANTSTQIRKEEEPKLIANEATTSTASVQSEDMVISDLSDYEAEVSKELVFPRLIKKIRDFSPDYRKKETNEIAEEESITSSRARQNSLCSSISIDSTSDNPTSLDLTSLDDYDYTPENASTKSKMSSDYDFYYNMTYPLIRNESLRSYTSRIKCVVEPTSANKTKQLETDEQQDIEIKQSKVSNDSEQSVEEDLPNLNSIKLRSLRIEINFEPPIKMTRQMLSKTLTALPKVVSASTTEDLYIANRNEDINYENFVKSSNEYVDNKINYKLELKKFYKLHNLSEPIYELDLAISKDQGFVGYFCNLIIGERTWYTIIKSNKEIDQAENSVSHKALEDLRSSLGDMPQIDDGLLIQKIIKLFNDKNEKLCCGILEKRFNDIYKQELIPGWLDSIKSSKHFAIKECLIEDQLISSVQLAS